MTTLPTATTPRIPVTTRYHGVDVTDEYRWLEDGALDDTVAWTKAQQHLTRTYFEAVPWREALRTRVQKLLKAQRTSYSHLTSGGNTFFALKNRHATAAVPGGAYRSGRPQNRADRRGSG